ncbi:MAG: hypothetical protein Q7R90_03935, partial [bacterium]|nr:hypothetical protein [bacterium]
MHLFFRHRVYIFSGLLALASVCLLIPLFAHAQGFVPLAEVPPNSKFGQLTRSRDFSGFINGLFKFAIAIGAIAAVLRLAYAGYLYMGQSDMWSHKGEAKQIITDVTIGLLLLLGIYLILYQINPDILRLTALQRIQQNQVQQGGPSGQGRTAPIPETGFAPGGRDPFLTPDCPAGQHK